MRCRVLVFARLAEALGAGELPLDLPEGATVGDALEALARAHGPVAQMRASLAVAVNERYARPAAAVRDGDTIALIPPVSGG